MQTLTKWTITDCGTGVYRAIVGTDGNLPENRYALIENTPRVRIRPAYFRVERGRYEDDEEYVEYRWPEHLDWCYGLKGDGPDDEESREWCDKVLIALGYKLE